MNYNITVMPIDNTLSGKRGIAYYVFSTGNIHITKKCAAIIEVTLWHETMHKILYECNFSDESYQESIKFDNIAYELENFLFG